MSLTQSDAASLFRCPTKFADTFERPDPFNEQNLVRGFINRKKGLTGGSLIITHVNQKEVEPRVVWGTPKLQYPTDFETGKWIVPEAPSFLLAEKWNGINVLLYRYDFDGKQFLTAKTKGAPFVSNADFGQFFDLVDEALGDVENFCELQKLLDQEGVDSLSCELAGRREPHLVRYSWDLKLIPLFTVGKLGEIKPVVSDRTKIRAVKAPPEIVSACQEAQALAEEVNQQWQRDQGLTAKYEHDHFLTEGKVLFLLDEAGVVPNRTLYKIKPPSIATLHQATFDSDMEARVKEAVEKIVLNEEPITEENLRSELDMPGPKEWSKWKKPIVKFLDKTGTKVETVDGTDHG